MSETKVESVPSKAETTVEVKASRTVALKFEAIEQAEGVGARVRRTIGNAKLRNFDPFLMLDEFKVKAPAGFQTHPHRGFETVTFMLDGKVEHEDFAGHRGVIGPGDLQWMTAGRGICHAEMPVGSDTCRGLQLWVNLKAADKMVEPAYQELVKEDIPVASKDGVTATVIAGTALGTTSKVYTRTPTSFLEFKMEAGSVLDQPIDAGWNSFAYVLTGSATFGPSGSDATVGMPHHVLAMSNKDGQDGVHIEAGKDGCHFVLVSGQPLNEPIAQHGPFVMNTREQIMEAIMDFQAGRNGFERSVGWNAEIDERGMRW